MIPFLIHFIGSVSSANTNLFSNQVRGSSSNYFIISRVLARVSKALRRWDDMIFRNNNWLCVSFVTIAFSVIQQWWICAKPSATIFLILGRNYAAPFLFLTTRLNKNLVWTLCSISVIFLSSTNLSFAVYAPDMPRTLPVSDFLKGLGKNLAKALKYWFHYTLVAVAWLGVVPLTSCKLSWL